MPGAYPGDDAPKEQIAAWMAAEAEKRGLPAQLPVMAALVESNLTNVNFGDADSLGYFQMRVSFWDSGPYAGFADDPKKQVDWFLDTAERVKEQRVSRGQSITDPNQFGEWIADVERPAEQYRGRYQLQLDKANGLLANAPKTPAAPEVAPAAAVAPAAPAAPAAPIDPGQFGQDGTGGTPDAAAQALLQNKNVVLDDVGVSDIKAGPDRSADRRRADEAQPGAQDRRLVHVLGPPAHDGRRLGLQPHVRPRPGHRVDRRRDRRARAARWRARSPRSSPSSTRRCGRMRSARRS